MSRVAAWEESCYWELGVRSVKAIQSPCGGDRPRLDWGAGAEETNHRQAALRE